MCVVKCLVSNVYFRYLLDSSFHPSIRYLSNMTNNDIMSFMSCTRY